jgi:hypothetical protein
MIHTHNVSIDSLEPVSDTMKQQFRWVGKP